MPNSEDEERPHLTCTSKDFQLSQFNKSTLTVSVKNSNQNYKIVAPDTTFNSIHQKSISSLDVSSGGLGISAGNDGIFVWESENGLIRRKLEIGHLGDINSVRLFPSGVVALTSGTDMRLKISSAEDGSNPVTLSGHTAAITNTAIIERGRNVLSVSKDGSIRLWNCGLQKTIEPNIEINDCINDVDITETGLNCILNNDEEMESDENEEIGTRGKILVVGTENGSVNLVDLKGRQIITSKKFSAAVNCVKFLEHENFLVVGLQDGQILVLDVPNLTEISKIHDSDSSVESLLTLRNGFVVGKYDGACLWYGFDPVHNDISKDVIVLTGADVDPITAMAKDQDYIFTSCRDGCIRKYSIINMFH